MIFEDILSCVSNIDVVACIAFVCIATVYSIYYASL